MKAHPILDAKTLAEFAVTLLLEFEEVSKTYGVEEKLRTFGVDDREDFFIRRRLKIQSFFDEEQRQLITKIFDEFDKTIDLK